MICSPRFAVVYASSPSSNQRGQPRHIRYDRVSLGRQCCTIVKFELIGRTKNTEAQIILLPSPEMVQCCSPYWRLIFGDENKAVTRFHSAKSPTPSRPTLPTTQETRVICNCRTVLYSKCSIVDSRVWLHVSMVSHQIASGPAAAPMTPLGDFIQYVPNTRSKRQAHSCAWKN